MMKPTYPAQYTNNERMQIRRCQQYTSSNITDSSPYHVSIERDLSSVADRDFTVPPPDSLENLDRQGHSSYQYNYPQDYSAISKYGNEALETHTSDKRGQSDSYDEKYLQSNVGNSHTNSLSENYRPEYRCRHSNDRSRSRSRTNDPSRSSSRRKYYRSRSRSRQRNYRSRSRSRQRHYRSRSRSRQINDVSRSESRLRYYRSRSQSRTRNNRSRSRSRRRNYRSRSRSKSRQKRKRSTSRSRYLNRSRSRSSSKHKHVNSWASESQSCKNSNIDPDNNLVEKWRLNNCLSSADMEKKLEELSKMNADEIVESEKVFWNRSTPADLYYVRDESNVKVVKGTEKLLELCAQFKKNLLDRGEDVRMKQTPYILPVRKTGRTCCMHKGKTCSSDSDSDGSENSLDDPVMQEMEIKRKHPYRLHQELWFNDPGEMNDGPLCRCSAKAKRSGIRHGIYAGETGALLCDKDTNNGDKLYHYRITISPPTNFLTRTPTIINHDDHEFIFEGFSMLSHYPIDKLPTCKVIRFNIEYMILYVEEKLPDNFTVRELDIFYEYLFKEILELVDFDLYAHNNKSGCPQFHFMPRFVRELPDNGRELLSMNQVLLYLIKSSSKLIDDESLVEIRKLPVEEWQTFVDAVKGMVVTVPGMKPSSLRVDQIDRNLDLVDEKTEENDSHLYPEIVHFGIRPPQLSYAGNPQYQKAWRNYVKFRHLIANMAKPTADDKRKLAQKENNLQTMRTQSKMKRDVTITVSSKGFYRTGFMCDVVQHALLIPVLVCHLRFHRSLNMLEENIGYKFKNRCLLQLAMTHPSYRENFGTNPDHARNSLTNCGIRQPEYGDRRIHYMNTRKRGINTLINIMARFGHGSETPSDIYHNERLEFLGDAVVEFVTTVHLFHSFPDLEEGGLATFRAALVQNQHLSELAKKLGLHEYMLYAHGSDLCHDLELKHAMANCFEALMGALFLDGDIECAGRVFGKTLFKEDEDLLDVWFNYPPHPLQDQEPQGDRLWIQSSQFLQKLTKFEEETGYEFNHIRLLARAFTDRSIGYTNLTMGSNQRLEFLGDSVLQLIASEYLYKHFPEHHEGHLSLLRSSLVNNKTQSVVCNDLGMTKYALYSNPKVELKTKDKADLVEAYLGALYVDSSLEACQVFCHVCFFPRLQDFIMNQDWNDPKSKLQQCCLTLRTMEGGEPDIPIYKVIECKGPTNTRVYTVAVYFRGRRLAKATGHSIQQAEMNAAKQALQLSGELFPQLDHQKRVIAKSLKTQVRVYRR